MPKLVVYGQEKEEQVTRLKLIDDGDGDIRLAAVDRDGRLIGCGNLLVFKADGRIIRPMSVNKNLGINLNEAGQLTFTDSF